MRRASIVLAIFLVVTSAPFVRAEEQSLSDAHLNVIRANCVNAQPLFNRVQASDKTSRINRGYNYEMTLRLMVAFNSRAALNRIDSPDLLSVTSEYEKTFKSFSSLYIGYDENISQLAEFDCHGQPTSFYDLLETTREQRVGLNAYVDALDKLLLDYQHSVDAIKKGLVS